MYDSRAAWVAGYGPKRIDGAGPLPRDALLAALASEEGEAHGAWDTLVRQTHDPLPAHTSAARALITTYHTYRGKKLVGVLYVRQHTQRNPTAQETQRRTVERTRKQQARTHEKGRYQAEVQKLRGEVQAARNRARAALGAARSSCKRERAATPAEIAELRAAKRAACETKKTTAKSIGRSLVAKRKARLREHRALRKILAARERTARKATVKRTSARERAGESDDEVRANVHPSLRPVFDAIRRKIKKTPKMDRTEAFEHWVEEHPDDVIQIQVRTAEKELAREIREHQRSGRGSRSRDPVPF